MDQVEKEDYHVLKYYDGFKKTKQKKPLYS